MTVPTPEPRVERFERMAFGLFLHWGLYSLLGRGEWVMHREGIPPEEYNRLAERFTAEGFDARAIARLARQAGMRYATLTSRHHDGFSLYDTRGLSEFDAPHSAAGRDLVAEFVEGCRAEDIVPMLYHTTLDWQWGSQTCSREEFDAYLDYLHRSVEVLCTHYGPLGGLWFDGNWSRTDVDWKEDRLYRTIRRLQPEAMIINNTGLGGRGVVGHPEIDSTTFEQGLPAAPDRTGWPKYVAGEMCQTFNVHWGIGRDDFAYRSPRDVIENLCLCRKAGANYLLNVGPTAEGAIGEYETAALRRVGRWVAMHEESIRRGRPTAWQCTGRDVVLADGDRAWYFAFDLGRQGDPNVVVSAGASGVRPIGGLDRRIKSVRWLDNDDPLDLTQSLEAGLAAIRFTGYPYGTNLVVRVAEMAF